MKIALDAMGGDFAPAVTVEGAVETVNELPDTEVVLAGDEPALLRELSSKKYPQGRISIVHATEVVGMEEPPLQAVRKKKDSSLRRAVEMVKAGQADAAVSAGNSGAMMALALFLLGRSEGVERPAIATEMPSFENPFLLLDAGANVDCSAENVLQFALMGDAYVRLVHKVPRPRVGLLSIGEEPSKGNELTKEAFKLLEKSSVNFIGNIESRAVFLGHADVVVCDGFVGNIFLKTSEGLAEVVLKMIRREIGASRVGKLGYLLMKSGIRNFKKKTDYDEYGGAPLLGIRGTCFISHGRSSPKAIKNALTKAAEFARTRAHEAISAEIREYHASGKTPVAG
ncbi:MAG: phosphate acyltransferase PlsX [Nitrospirota bacterium]|jgi:glycerol-3-phosphate acyltransferase PlsX